MNEKDRNDVNLKKRNIKHCESPRESILTKIDVIAIKMYTSFLKTSRIASKCDQIHLENRNK
jgi:hypothetical protein